MKFLLIALLIFPTICSADVVDVDVPQCKLQKKYYTEAINLFLDSTKLYDLQRKLFDLDKLSAVKLDETVNKVKRNRYRLFQAQLGYTDCQKRYRVTT